MSRPLRATSDLIPRFFLLLLLFAFSPSANGDEIVDDERENFEASVYVGLAIDSFAAEELDKYLNPDESGEIRERGIAGVSFAYRLAGDPSDSAGSQAWVYGETVHGVRSTDVDCEKTPNLTVCDDFTPEQTLYLLRNASSLEGFLGLRWEFGRFQTEEEHAAKPYLKLQAGFLSVSGGGGDVVDVHHVGLGAIITKGRFLDSYLEVGFGKTDLYQIHPKDRWKIDGYLNWEILEGNGELGLYGFAQIVVDADIGRGSDSVQTYLGIGFDPAKLFN